MDRPVDTFAQDPPPPGAADFSLRGSVFYKKRVTGIALFYARPSLLDEMTERALTLWFVEHGYDESELKRRTVEVTYRVLPRLEGR
jgi:hypothetical protein